MCSGGLIRMLDSYSRELTPHTSSGGRGDWQVVYDWQSDKLGQATLHPDCGLLDSGKLEAVIPVVSNMTPGITGKLRFVVSAWNAS